MLTQVVLSDSISRPLFKSFFGHQDTDIFMNSPDGLNQLIQSIPSDESRIAWVGAPWDFDWMAQPVEEQGLSSRVIKPQLPFEIFSALDLNEAIGNPRDLLYGTIYNDFWHRPWYAFPLITAVAQAERLGLRAITVVEMGVWLGEGLLNLASLCQLISTTVGIEIRVVGFDTGTGLPSVADYRDHPELWYTGELASPDLESLKARLPENTKLVIGDIRDTIDKFTEQLTSEAPLAFMALDVDTYSSSVDCLKVFRNANPTCLLPATPVYVDDSYINIMQNEYCGEALAIHEFNESELSRKILKKIVRTNRPQMPWHHAIHFCHVFDHPARKSHSGINFIGLNVHAL